MSGIDKQEPTIVAAGLGTLLSSSNIIHLYYRQPQALDASQWRFIVTSTTVAVGLH
jgi:hypothetical protein